MAAAPSSSSALLPRAPYHHPYPFSSTSTSIKFNLHSHLHLQSRRHNTASKFHTRAKKKNNSKSNTRNTKKDYTNSKDYDSPQSESLGFFPEAVLLKKKTVQEDGQALPQFADAQEEKVYQALSLQLESTLNLQRMRHYEVVFLIHEQHDDQVDEIVTQVEDFIREKKGRIWRLNDWGLRPLAYEVKKAWEAHYILMNFEIDAKFINDFKTMLDKDERVIRHLVTKQDKAETEYSPPPMDYQTLLAKQGIRDDDGFWDEDDDDDDGDDYTMYNDDDDDSNDEGADGGKDEGEGEEEVIYVDGDGEEEDPDTDTGEIQDVVRKVGDVTR